MVGDIREQCVVAVRGGADSDVKERKKPVWLARKSKHNHLTNFAYCQEEYDDETVPFERVAIVGTQSGDIPFYPSYSELGADAFI